MKKTTRKNNLIVILLAIIAIFTASVIALLQLTFAFAIVQSEVSGAYEMYSLELRSSKGPTESWEETKANIKANYSDSSWAFKVASGNAGKATSILLVSVLICLTIISYLPINARIKVVKRNTKAKAHHTSFQVAN